MPTLILGKHGIHGTMTPCCRHTRWLSIGLVVLCLEVLPPSLAYGEAYIAGQLGVIFPQSLSDGKITTPGFGVLSISDQALKSSLMGGVKLGFYLPRIRWFGFETEVFYTTPHIKQQPIALKGPGGSVTADFLGLQNRVITWAPVNVMFRYHKTRLQPYMGIGPGVFFARIKDPSVTPGDNTQSSTWRIGVNAQAGLRYYITRHWTMFGEYKFNFARFDYKDTPNLFGFKADYTAHIVALGLSYHF